MIHIAVSSSNKLTMILHNKIVNEHSTCTYTLSASWLMTICSTRIVGYRYLVSQYRTGDQTVNNHISK
jgi:hypothetical protein